MREILFASVGGIGLLMIILMGNRLLADPSTGAARFARLIASSYAILIVSLVIIIHRLDSGWVILSLILSVLTFIVAYPLAYYFHQRKSKNS